MPTRAEWRPRPDDPRTGLGWLVADADARKLPALPALGLALSLAGLADLWSPWVLLGLPPLVLSARIHARPRDLAPLRTTPPPGPAFDCRVESLADVNALGRGALLGADEGIVTFVDGWLHYAGLRTEFALRRADLRDASHWAGRIVLQLDESTALALEASDGRDADQIARVFRLWSSSMAIPLGESMLPSREVHPTGLARAWRDALLASAGVLAFVGLMVALDYGLVVFFVAGGGWFASFRRLGRLRRLAREEGLARLKGRTA